MFLFWQSRDSKILFLLATKQLTELIFFSNEEFRAQISEDWILSFLYLSFFKSHENQKPKKLGRLKKSITKNDLELQYGKQIWETLYEHLEI